MTPARRGAIGLALLVAGCTADMAPPLEWRVVAGEGLDPDAVVAIEARITEGNCGLADRRAPVWWGAVRRDEEARFTAPGRLATGTWCFSAVAHTTTCELVARGSVVRRLPEESAPFDVVLELAPGASECPAACDRGVCPAPSLAIDAGVDPTRDAGGETVDGGSDGGPGGRCPEVPCPDGERCEGGLCTCGAASGETEACAGALECCDDACVDTSSSCEACGACGLTCGDHQACSESVLVCDSGWADCNGAPRDGCEIDTTTDNANCGGCGTRCEVANGSGTCVAGVCQIGSCSPGFADCAGGVTDGCETRTSNDRTNCGGCGTTCAGTDECSGGTCGCTAGRADCDGDMSTGCETPLGTMTDCAVCGDACGAQETCTGGACVCNAGFLDCDGLPGCEQAIDPGNCGACGAACGAGETCNAALLRCECGTTRGSSTPGADACSSSSQECCGTSCVNTGTDEANCGTCGRMCATGETCGSGICRCGSTFGPVCTGAPGSVCCGSSCRNTTADQNNCGGCGVACQTGEMCVTGSCSCGGTGPDCAGTTASFCCGTACVDRNSDEANCGSCGTTCDSGELCTSGSCRCGGTGSNCSGTMTSTCCGTSCRNLNNDETDCGGCGMACEADETCSSGICHCGSSSGPVCGATETCCDLSGPAVCADLMTSTTSCGACGNACRPGETCVGGMCVCDTGFACNSDEQCVDMGGPAKVCYCPSAMTVCPGTPDATCCGESTCSDTRSDARNCGPSCERCGSGEVCNAGACSCPDAPGGAACTGPFAICCPGAGCVNRLTDPNHCSMCGNACAAGFACQSGSCRCGSVSNSCPANEVCDPTEVPPRCECGSNPTCPAGLSCNAMGFCV